MAFKQEILAKVPVSLHREPHVQALLENVKKHTIADNATLSRFLQQEIASAEQFLRQNKQTALGSVRFIKEKTVQLEMLRKCQQVARRYLES